MGDSMKADVQKSDEGCAIWKRRTKESLEDSIVPPGEDKKRSDGCLLLINAQRYPHGHAGTIRRAAVAGVDPAHFLNAQAVGVLCST